MANVSRPDGLKPAGRVIRLTRYLASGTIYPGDLVKLDSSGGVTACSAGDAAVGVSAEYGVATDSINVWDHPDQLFEAQADDSTIDAQTDLNLNYNIVAGSPNTTYRRSGMQIDASTQATNSNQQLKVLSVVPRPSNDLGDAVKCVCTINNHQHKGGTGTLGT